MFLGIDVSKSTLDAALLLRQEAVRYSLEGLSQRKVARLLRVAPQSVANWLVQAGASRCKPVRGCRNWIFPRCRLNWRREPMA